MNSFLPKGYELPETASGYMRLEQGANKFRVLSSAIVGYEYWTTENKPVRSKESWSEKPKDVKTDKDGKYRINHFWAFIVWNYKTGSVQILEVTQKTIQKSVEALVASEAWGDPKGYDIVITKTGEQLKTEYHVNPEPPKALEEHVQALYKDTYINLNALYTGANPFDEATESVDPDSVKV